MPPPPGPRIAYTEGEIEYIDAYVKDVMNREKGHRHLTSGEVEEMLAHLNGSEERKKIVAEGGQTITAARLSTFVSNRKQKFADPKDRGGAAGYYAILDGPGEEGLAPEADGGFAV